MLPQALVAHGLFPTSPSQLRMAISLDLLEFYRTLCQQSSDAVTALASALSLLYSLHLLGASARRSYAGSHPPGDLHVALDGNFHHRHLKLGGDGVPFHQSTRFLSKEFVDEIGARVTAARARPPQRQETKLPDDIVDADQESYKAARGDNKRQSNEAFDENGVMALKDAVALLVALFEMILDSVTLVGLYDIACVLDCSIQLYDLLPEAVVARLQLTTAVMHAYGHQWACQLHYNPRMRVGLGITNREGTERLWSRLHRMIGLERRASRAKRCWMLDCQCDSITMDLREGLGAWICKRLHKNIQKKEAEAVRMLRKLDTTLAELRQYWDEQKDAQGSIHAYSGTSSPQEGAFQGPPAPSSDRYT
ncbi:hypothetical protein PM082_010129 [Marasmius tenuissimus]|nr:hypothetical protein PM082_010129 [Marasmius tenuissimus]